ncbi:MAG: PilZ domain-containing protein [Silvanigrellaceae bacterium]|nr:PilZ domain-containing protein [Silvanigrellaceae bacterium]
MNIWLNKIKKKAEDMKVAPSPAPKSKDLQPKKTKDKEQKRGLQKRIIDCFPVKISSLGDPCCYNFETVNFSVSGLMIKCTEPERYPFLSHLTLVDGLLELSKHKEHNKVSPPAIKFIGKVMRVPDISQEDPDGFGYGIKIVQIEWDDFRLLENYISEHGTFSSEEKTPYLQSA